MIDFETTSLGVLPLSLVGVGVLVLAYVASYVIHPLVRRFAIRHELLDHPDGDRRTHDGAIPRLGGIGVFAAMLAAVVCAAWLETPERLVHLLPFILSIGAGATMLFVVGLFDDLIGVPPAIKIVVQSVAAIIVWRSGFQLSALILPGGHVVALGLASLPLAIVWIVGLSNAFNLVDGADGLAGGVALIALAATAVAALVLHNTVAFWCSAALFGAMLGFLRFNFPPARIFLGDSGSLVVGFLLAVLTVKGMTRRDGATFAIGPIFALSYPLLDTGISMLRRWLRGEPLSRADGRHIHHQLRKLGLGPRQSLGVLLGLSLVVAALGVSASLAPPEFTMAMALAGLVLLAMILVYGARWLQYHELLEAGSSIASAAMTGRSRLQDKIYARDIARLILHAKSTVELRAIIEDNASTFRFEHMQLRWGLSDETPPSAIASAMSAARLWSFDYPIMPRSARTDSLFLSVWCAVDQARSASAERVVQIIAPAIAAWMRKHLEMVRPSSFADVSRARVAVRGTAAEWTPNGGGIAPGKSVRRTRTESGRITLDD